MSRNREFLRSRVDSSNRGASHRAYFPPERSPRNPAYYNHQEQFFSQVCRRNREFLHSRVGSSNRGAFHQAHFHRVCSPRERSLRNPACRNNPASSNSRCYEHSASNRIVWFQHGLALVNPIQSG